MLETASEPTVTSNGTARRRSPRTHLPDAAIVVEGTLPISQVPDSARGRLGKRRWEELANQIVMAANKRDRDTGGESLVLNLTAGTRADIVRAGVGEELKRQGYSSQTRSFTQEDGSIKLYLYAVPIQKQDSF
jgi:hypothetical protein